MESAWTDKKYIKCIKIPFRISNCSFHEDNVTEFDTHAEFEDQVEVYVNFFNFIQRPTNIHDYFTNYHTVRCFDTIMSSSGNLQSIPYQVKPVHTGQHYSNINIQTVYTATTTD
jgi:hypothetical protein